MATLPAVDAVMVGFGWTGGIIANELLKAGVKVVGLERGDFRNTYPDFAIPGVHDELAYALRYKLFQNAAKETLTARNDRTQTALPVRQFGSFLPGDGLGGAGVHWNGVTWRFLPWDFETRSRSIARYGAAILGEDCTSQDWGVTYDELEPYYDKFEYLCGIAGKAGNIKGQIQPGGNPFEGPRSREYPSPPQKTSYAMEVFGNAATSLGYHPFPQPSANSSQFYTNPEGVHLGSCVYCGYCERFACEMSAKASMQTTLLPKLSASPNFELRTNAKVLKVNLDSTGKKAVSVTYLDAQGREQIQPANMIFITAWALNNVRLLLLSGIGKPYDPVSNTGVVGRNYAYQVNTGGAFFFENGKVFNLFMGSGALGTVFDDFNGDNFDHGPYGFIGGADINQNTNHARPVEWHPTPAGTPRWGGQWKRTMAHYYNRAFNFNAQGGVQSYRGNYLDLDPTYRDVYGQPLLRMTFDWGPHEHKQSAFMAGIHQKVGKAAGATSITVGQLAAHWDTVPYQSTHNTGGAIMGSDPRTSVTNKYGQTWDVSNVFVTGASSFPQNAGYNPTGTVGALAYHTSEAVVSKYLKSPGPLV
ncbi:MAG TPA: GMC family oxidoreductase [Candidatus Sulfotelmatobacter sp.]|nr:GMC family oxidoreductase [Candidatus Sulfotelmatobacter sp.]